MDSVLNSIKQVDKKYYSQPKYSTLDRFITYFYQIDSVRKTEAKKVLLIGVGDGAVPFYLEKVLGLEITTCDIDAELNPTVTADIRQLPFSENEFDCVCAFEVLEHIPFEEAEKAYYELVRVSKKNVIISIPHRRTGFELVFKFPYARSLVKKDYLRLALRLPVKFPGFAISKQHYWEIDWYTTKLSKVRSLFKSKCKITSETTPVLDMYRRFFVLEKKN